MVARDWLLVGLVPGHLPRARTCRLARPSEQVGGTGGSPGGVPDSVTQRPPERLSPVSPEEAFCRDPASSQKQSSREINSSVIEEVVENEVQKRLSNSRALRTARRQDMVEKLIQNTF